MIYPLDHKALGAAIIAYNKDRNSVETAIKSAITAYLTAAQTDGWQNIESAPKDGTQILIWDYGYKIAKWTVCGRKDEMGWANEHFWLMFSENECDCSNDFESYEPKKWQPVPNPPTTTEKE